MTHTAGARIPLSECEHGFAGELLVPHQRVEPRQCFRPLEVAAQIEGGADSGCDGKTRDTGDLVVSHSLRAGDQTLLCQAFHSDEFDRNIRINPGGTV